MHGDRSSTGHLDVRERFTAAVGVFSHLAVLALEMLHYINDLARFGLADLPVGTFFEQVVVTDIDREQQVLVYTTDSDVDMAKWLNNFTEIPESFRPLYDVVREEEEEEEGTA